jgi:excisionase family DNA binding protein
VPTTVTLAVAWSTKWSIEVDGVPVAPTATADKLLQVAVPAGSSVITLTYGPDRADAIGRAISLACVLLAATVLVLDRRRRRSGTPAEAATAVAVATATTAPDRPEATASPGGAGGAGGASTASMATVAAVLTERAAGPEDRDRDRPGRERDPGDVLTLAEAAALLRVSPSALERQLHQGTIPGRRIGEDWRLSRAAVISWLAAALDDPALPTPAALFATATTDSTTDRPADPGEPPPPGGRTDPGPGPKTNPTADRPDTGHRGTGFGRTDPSGDPAWVACGGVGGVDGCRVGWVLADLPLRAGR